MKNIKAKLVALFVGITAFCLSGCMILTEENQPAIESLTRSAVAQMAYSSMVKKPEAKKTYETIVEVLEQATLVANMTPNQLSDSVKTHLSTVVKNDADMIEYSIMIDGVLDLVFSKYKIAWSDNMNQAQLIGLFTVFKDAITVAINRYEVTSKEVLSGMSTEMPNDPFLK